MCNMKNTYHERYRPQFHFTAREKWLNDPNGLVYYDGEYHLFFQHQTGSDWGPSRWGHAISSDLVHWKQRDHAIEPHDHGWIWSGSSVVDYRNTAGFKTGSEEVIVAVYTAGDTTVETNRPCTQNISFSNDRARTWNHFEGNPVISHIVAENRDPKVIWYAPESKWIMALFLSGNEYALLSSPDLKTWKGLSTVHVPGGRECPDLFALPVNGDAADLKVGVLGSQRQLPRGRIRWHGVSSGDRGSARRSWQTLLRGANLVRTPRSIPPDACRLHGWAAASIRKCPLTSR